MILYATLAASLFWIIINPPHKIIAAHYSWGAWLFLAVFSFLSMLLPFTFYFAGLKLLVPTKAIIASCLEPVFAILIAAIALNEVRRIGAGDWNCHGSGRHCAGSKIWLRSSPHCWPGGLSLPDCSQIIYKRPKLKHFGYLASQGNVQLA